MKYHTKAQLTPETPIKKFTTTATSYASAENFDTHNLDHTLVNNIARKGYQTPSEIQNQCIEQVRTGWESPIHSIIILKTV